MNRSKREIQVHHWAYCGYVVIFSLALQTLMIQSAVAQNDDDKKADKPKPEMLECKVRVTDPDGNPVEDATVYCTGMRSRLEPGSHWGWGEERFGPVPRIKTESDGIANMPYPKYLAEKLETGKMTWSVDHPDFVSFREDRNVKDDPAEIQLQRGFRIALTAKNASTGKPIKKDLYAVIGLRGVGKWELKKNRTLVSGVFKKKNCYLRVMQCTEGQPTLFSDMITVEPGEKSRVLLRDIELSLGTRLEGKLDSSVTRPVKNGHVAGSVGIQLDPNDSGTSWDWSDKAEIKEDGSFVFESLPSDVVWQMIPICDNWVPASPKLESVAAHFPDMIQNFERTLADRRLPQPVKLADDNVSVTLRMIPAATIAVTFVDPKGEPISDVKTYTNPNQLWLDGGSQILGQAYRTRDFLISRRRGETPKWPISERFQGVSNANGVCEIGNLPPMTRGDLAVLHDKFELPIVNGDRGFQYALKEGEQKELTIKLQAKGEGPKLGEEVAED